MVPLVDTVEELRLVRAEIARVLHEAGGGPDLPVGTVIELPRAALAAAASPRRPGSSPSEPTT
jgi:pyruvate,orthophosphate dikinase